MSTRSRTGGVVGRESERAALAALLERAREGDGGAFVVAGEPGMGKSALLADLASSADGFTVLHTSGIESEAPLPFAALHRLLRPVMRHAERLPAPQTSALRVAFGEEAGGPADRFLVFLGTLNLLSEASTDGPLLAVVDDAHWLDEGSAAALQFVARRLQAEAVALVFGARVGDVRTFEAGDLPTLPLTGLDRDAVVELLSDQIGAQVSPEVAAWLLASTGGNPLALVELPDVLSVDQLTGRAALPRRMPVPGGVERVFLERARRLPPGAQAVLLVAAADDSAQLTTVTRAARALGAGPEDLDQAERSGLVTVTDGTVEMRHPLVRSAVYNGATSLERRSAHRALADALTGDRDADRRVWHLAAATDQPDEEVVAELDEAAYRAHLRGGHEAASSAYERAAELTVDPAGRGERLYAAARCAWLTGHPDRARRLSEDAVTYAAEPGLRADALRLRSRVEWNTGDVRRAHRMVLQAAAEIASADPGRAREMAMFAAALATFGADSGIDIDPTRVAPLPGPDAPARERCFAALIEGLDHVRHGRWPEATEALRRSFAAGDGLEGGDDQDLLPNLGIAALHLGDDTAAAEYHGQILARARDTGAMVMVLYAQTRLALTDLATGRWSAATARSEEAVRLGGETGQAVLGGMPRAWLGLLAALRGADDADARIAEVEQEFGTRTQGILDVILRDTLRWARAVRAADQPPAAFLHLDRLSHDVIRRMAAVDRVETAVRADQPETAERWVEDLERFADATDQAWAAAVAAHGRAVLAGLAGPAGSAEAGKHFERALELHQSSPRVFDRARTQLAYGEHLRRARRRVEARTHLRAALATFEELGAKPWVDRTVQELRASGERARRRDVTTTTALTPQETQVAALVSQGMSNREVAAQLFLSPRTIDFHLRNVFAKTGITSRTELARLELA